MLNLGNIGNRLLHDSPLVPTSPFGAALGESGVSRFERDFLSQPGVKYVFVCLGINDILFPGFAFTPADEKVSTKDIIADYRQLIARAHKKGIRIIGTTIPPFKNAFFKQPHVEFFTPEREAVRKRSTPGFCRVAHSTQWLILTHQCAIQPTRPEYEVIMTRAITCT